MHWLHFQIYLWIFWSNKLQIHNQAGGESMSHYQYWQCLWALEKNILSCENSNFEARIALTISTDLVMALSQQQVTASNSLVSCWTVIACCCSYQTLATFMSGFLSLPYCNLWEPLHSKQKLHEQFWLVVLSCLHCCSLENISWIVTLGHVFHSESYKHSHLTY